MASSKKSLLKRILLPFVRMMSFKLDLKFKITFKPRSRSVIIHVFIVYQIYVLRMLTQKNSFIMAKSETQANERIMQQTTTSITICK